MTQKTMADEIARKHGIRLDPNDPILILGTVGESISSTVAKTMDVACTKVSNDLGVHLTAAKAATAKMVNDGGAWLVEQVNQAHASALAEIRSAHASAVAEIKAAHVEAVAEYTAEVERATAGLVSMLRWAAYLGGAGVLLIAGGILGLVLKLAIG